MVFSFSTEGLVNHFETPGAVLVFLGGISDANTLVGGHFAMEAVVDDIEFFAADVFPV